MGFKDYVVGDDVQAASPDDGRRYPGVVSKVNSDGTFQVKWDDPDGGPETNDVAPKDMKKVTIFKDYKEGDVVDALFPEDGQMYPATVLKGNSDGTFQVKWEDPDGGPEESPVSPKNMKYPPIPFEKLEVGQKYTGNVRSITDFGAFVDIGAEGDGLLHISRISEERVNDVHDYLEEGQDVEVWISGLRDDGKFGLTMIEGRLDGGGGPRKPADLTAFEEISSEDWLEGTVRNIASFGAFVSVTLPTGESADGLVHISQLTDGFVEDVSSVVESGQSVKVRIISVDLERGKMSLSMKDGFGGSTQAARPPADLSAFEGIPSDQWLSGKVARVASFGAFVTVTTPDGEATADGLVHITQIKDGFVESVEDEVQEGQEVQVRIQSVDVMGGKISLSMKSEDGFGGSTQAARPPADLSAFEGIPSDQWLTGKVARVAGFGAFVTVTTPDGEATADGLVHITQIKDGFVESVEDELEQDQEVQVRIQSVDVMDGKLSLTMKPEDY